MLLILFFIQILSTNLKLYNSMKVYALSINLGLGGAPKVWKWVKSWILCPYCMQFWASKVYVLLSTWKWMVINKYSNGCTHWSIMTCQGISLLVEGTKTKRDHVNWTQALSCPQTGYKKMGRGEFVTHPMIITYSISSQICLFLTSYILNFCLISKEDHSIELVCPIWVKYGNMLPVHGPTEIVL